MVSLFELSTQFKQLFDSLDIIMEDEDEDMLEAWFDTLEGIEGEIEDKVENIALYIEGTLAEADALKKKRDSLNARIKAKTNAAERMKGYLKDSMIRISLNKVQTDKVAVSIRNNPESVNVLDEQGFIEWAEKNNEDLLRYKTPEINKTAVKKALQDGREIPCCELTRTKSVIIK